MVKKAWFAAYEATCPGEARTQTESSHPDFVWGTVETISLHGVSGGRVKCVIDPAIVDRQVMLQNLMDGGEYDRGKSECEVLMCGSSISRLDAISRGGETSVTKYG